MLPIIQLLINSIVIFNYLTFISQDICIQLHTYTSKNLLYEDIIFCMIYPTYRKFNSVKQLLNLNYDHQTFWVRRQTLLIDYSRQLIFLRHYCYTHSLALLNQQTILIMIPSSTKSLIGIPIVIHLPFSLKAFLH